MDELLIKLRLEKIIEHIEEIQNDMKNVSLDDFKKKSLLARGTCFSIEQISENLNSVSPILEDSYPEIDWEEIIGTRVVIAHHYHKIDYEKIYKIVFNDLPTLKKQIIHIIEDRSFK